ncbi:hypothetical protein D3C71_1424360 [compost metagenome]
MALGLGLRLQIAAGQVQADAIAEHQRLGLVDRQLAGRGVLADRHHQLHLMVQVLGGERVGDHIVMPDHDRIGRFAEEHRAAAIIGGRHGRTHFARVISEVAAHAVYATHREGTAAGDRNAGLLGRGDYIGHARVLWRGFAAV